MSNIYQKKYQKYKFKYLNLLNQSGGMTPEEEKIKAIKEAIKRRDNRIYEASTYSTDQKYMEQNINFYNNEYEKEEKIIEEKYNTRLEEEKKKEIEEATIKNVNTINRINRINRTAVNEEDMQQSYNLSIKEYDDELKRIEEKYKKLLPQQTQQQQQAQQQQQQAQQQAQQQQQQEREKQEREKQKLEEQKQEKQREQRLIEQKQREQEREKREQEQDIAIQKELERRKEILKQQQALQQQALQQQQQQALQQQQQQSLQQQQQQPQNSAIAIANQTLTDLSNLKKYISQTKDKSNLNNIMDIINQMEKNQTNLKTNYNCNCQRNNILNQSGSMTLEEIKQQEKKEKEHLERWFNNKKAEFIQRGNGNDVKLLEKEKEKHLQIIQKKYEQLQ